MIHLNSFPKSEHLCGEKRITRLFTQGKAFIAYPLRVIYLIESKKDAEAASVMVSVPKKRFKRAVKRNRLKRLMREAYRLNKQMLIEKLNEKELQIQIAFNYVSDDELDFATVEKKMKLALQKIIDIIELSDIKIS
ncbi:MAG: ribonuclease P protein component [Paludibacter sp.]|nr:ribonuclease P protein component [Paludibacter sp.]